MQLQFNFLSMPKSPADRGLSRAAGRNVSRVGHGDFAAGGDHPRSGAKGHFRIAVDSGEGDTLRVEPRADLDGSTLQAVPGAPH